MTTLAAHLHAGMCRFLLMVAEFDRRGLYESWECRGTAQWLTWKCGIAARTAREQVHVARALEKLPATAAFGELSYAKVRAMARVVGVVPEDELMNLATAATAGQLERILGTFAHHHRNQTNPPEVRQGMRTWWDDDTMFGFRGALSPEDGAVVAAALATMRKRRQAAESGSAEPLSDEGKPDTDVFDPQVLHRRRAQDLVDMARAAMGWLTVTARPCRWSSTPTWTSCWACRTREGRGSTAVPRCRRVVRRLGCDATWRLVIEDQDRNPLYVGRAHKDPNTFQRAAVSSRSGGRARCPHCLGAVRHIHHVWWWSKAGPPTSTTCWACAGTATR